MDILDALQRDDEIRRQYRERLANATDAEVDAIIDRCLARRVKQMEQVTDTLGLMLMEWQRVEENKSGKGTA